MNRIVILGAGESGAGAAVLAKKEGFDVFISDMSKIADKYKKMLDDHHIEWEEGKHTEEKILNADEIIKSPGIPDTAPMIQKIIVKGIHIISEIEFAGRYTHSKDDLYHRFKWQDHCHLTYLPHLQRGRLRCRVGRKHW